MRYNRYDNQRDALCNRDDIQVVHPDMEEAGRPQRDNGRADIAVRDDLYPKDIGDGPSVTTIDQILYEVESK